MALIGFDLPPERLLQSHHSFDDGDTYGNLGGALQVGWNILIETRNKDSRTLLKARWPQGWLAGGRSRSSMVSSVGCIWAYGLTMVD